MEKTEKPDLVIYSDNKGNVDQQQVGKMIAYFQERISELQEEKQERYELALARIAELEDQVDSLKKAIINGNNLYANLKWDDDELTPYMKLEKELSDTKANLGRAYNGIKHRDQKIQAYKEYMERNGIPPF
jgi:peptidoglycan hydrolase CwlO-like protein